MFSRRRRRRRRRSEKGTHFLAVNELIDVATQEGALGRRGLKVVRKVANALEEENQVHNEPDELVVGSGFERAEKQQKEFLKRKLFGKTGRKADFVFIAVWKHD